MCASRNLRFRSCEFPWNSWNSEKSLLTKLQSVQQLPANYMCMCKSGRHKLLLFHNSLVQHNALYLRTQDSVNFAAEAPILGRILLQIRKFTTELLQNSSLLTADFSADFWRGRTELITLLYLYLRILNSYVCVLLFL